MNTPFSGNYRITQVFGSRPDYYRQFGLAGHEGLDLVPQSGSWDVLAIEDGQVVRDENNPRSGAYGNHVVVLTPSKRAWWFCHLASNDVAHGQQVKRGQKLGVMGATGNTQGAHLHLGLRLANAQGQAINTNNGYNGFVNPLPILEDINRNDNQPAPQDTQKVIDQLRSERDTNWNLYQNALKEIEKLKGHTCPPDPRIELIKAIVNG